jgi:hypothetical protein
MKVFLNVSNHPSDRWDESQKKGALELFQSSSSEEVKWLDIAYPAIPPQATLPEVKEICDTVVSQIKALVNEGDEVIALVQGEMTSLFYLVPALQKQGIKVFAATTERVAVENGGVKTSIFKFCKFREYPTL